VYQVRLKKSLRVIFVFIFDFLVPAAAILAGIHWDFITIETKQQWLREVIIPYVELVAFFVVLADFIGLSREPRHALVGLLKRAMAELLGRSSKTNPTPLGYRGLRIPL
jgi:hypothetical protein